MRPLEKLDLPEGARVRIKIEGIFGLLEGWDIDPQELKDELRKLHD